MKFFTEVDPGILPVSVSLKDRIMVLGSCFADSIGAKLAAAGFDVCINPFGTLYNPASIAAAVARLESAAPFCESECVQMGAGSELICSYSHHTSFARNSKEEFLQNANAALEAATAFWKSCNKVIITLGTAWVWRHDGKVVSNCLKRPAKEFTHEMLSLEECCSELARIVETGTDKEFILTVSPIRHMSQGAHANTLSKATLQMAADKVTEGARCCYFPSYEILLDELRDYRFYADDLVHPSSQAVELIWEKFLTAAVPAGEHAKVSENEKAARRLAHRPLR